MTVLGVSCWCRHSLWVPIYRVRFLQTSTESKKDKRWVIHIERMQPIPRDSNDNGVVTMLVYHNKPTLLLTVHQHGGDDVTCISSIVQESLNLIMPTQWILFCFNFNSFPFRITDQSEQPPPPTPLPSKKIISCFFTLGVSKFLYAFQHLNKVTDI